MIRSLNARAPRALPFLLSAGVAALLAACGGSGGASLEAATTTVTGKITDASGAAITGVKVDVGVASGTTGSDGNFSFSFATSNDISAAVVVATVSKTGYTTCTTTLSGSTGTGGSATLAGCTTLAALGAGELPVADDGAKITRLGNSVATAGDVNTRFVNATATATSLVINLGAPPANVATYAKLNVKASFRGLEANACADSVKIFQSTSTTPGSGFSQTFVSPALQSNTDASAAAQTFTVTLAAASPAITAAGGNLYVQFNSGACSSGDAADDFEVSGITAAFAN